MNEAAARPQATVDNALLGALGVLVGLLVFGDYLALSVSRALTGSAGNWIVFAAVLQPIVVVVALLVGQTRQRVPLALLLGFGGLCAIAFGHGLGAWLAGNELTDYGSQKLWSLFLLLGPALLCGLLVGNRAELPGARTMPWLMAPLLSLVLVSLAINPRLLTIEFFNDPPVYLGALVMPTHQPLAMCLAKAGLLCFALDMRGRSTRAIRVVRLAFVGAMVGLVLLTGARSYALALVVALAAQSLVSGRRVGILLVGTAIALALFHTYASEVVHDRFDLAQALESAAYRERELAWQVAWMAFEDHVVVGVGPGAFAEAGGWYGRVYPHNLPLEVAAEFGLAGLCCLVSMLVTALWLPVRLWCRGERPSTTGVFAIGLVVFALGGSLAVGDLIRNYFLWFGLGLAASSLQRGAVSQPAPRPAPALASAPAPSRGSLPSPLPALQGHA